MSHASVLQVPTSLIDLDWSGETPVATVEAVLVVLAAS